MILAFDTFKPYTFVDAFRFMADNPGLMWQKTAEHLQISGEAMGIALLVAIPLGVSLGHIHRGSFISINLANIGRALPSLAVIAIGLGIFGIGTTNVVFALVVLAFPLMLTNAYVAVDNIDADVIESARGMGMRPHQNLATRQAHPVRRLEDVSRNASQSLEDVAEQNEQRVANEPDLDRHDGQPGEWDE